MRLRTRVGALNFAAHPAGGDVPISAQGALPLVGGTRHYQVWYRNSANFCTSAAFNLTNSVTTIWQP